MGCIYLENNRLGSILLDPFQPNSEITETNACFEISPVSSEHTMLF